MKPATQFQADAFIRHMAEKFHARVVRKSDAIEMQIIASAFDAIRAFGPKLPSSAEFLHQCATTLGFLVYMPDGISPDEQISAFAHECQHVHQFWNGGLHLPGGPGMAWLYVTQPEARVRYEANAYHTTVEVEYLRTGSLPDIGRFRWPLEGGYALSKEHVQLGLDLLELGATSLASGIFVTQAGIETRDWLTRNAPDLISS